MANDDIETSGDTAEVDHAAENAALRRELAFTKVGIDTLKGTGKLLFEGYSGEPTEEAVRAAALEYGVLRPEPEPGPEITPAEAQSESLRRATSTGASVDDGSEDPRITAKNVAFDSLKTKTREAAMVDGIRVLATAAKNGDARVGIGRRG